VIAKTDGRLVETVEVTNYPDGRPKEALQRLADGKAEWRLVYAYKDNAVTIDQFYDYELTRKGQTTATFHLDDQGRIQLAEVQRRDEIPVGNFSDDFDGRYSYSYLPDGRKTLSAAETYPNPHPGGSCTFDTAYFPNGLIDESTARSSSGVWCARKTGEKTEEKFDAEGNLIVRRSGGRNVNELGRAKILWKDEVTYDVRYY
jgi:hypothetical protein